MAKLAINLTTKNSEDWHMIDTSLRRSIKGPLLLLSEFFRCIGTPTLCWEVAVKLQLTARIIFGSTYRAITLIREQEKTAAEDEY